MHAILDHKRGTYMTKQQSHTTYKSMEYKSYHIVSQLFKLTINTWTYFLFKLDISPLQKKFPTSNNSNEQYAIS